MAEAAASEAIAEATKASSSTILTEILTSETADWREAINHFMEQKTTEFQAIMKTTIQNTMSEKLGNFYNRSFDHDNVLFDTDGTDIVKKTNIFLETNKNNGYMSVEGRKIAQQQINELAQLVKTNGYKCFHLSCSRYTGNGYDSNLIYIFKHFMISNSKQPHDKTDRPVYIKHNLANDILFTIKYFQMPHSGGFEGGLKQYNDHPEYFRQNCSEFESICKREYEMIQIKKDELQRLIDENVANTDHYRSLEDQIKTLADEKQAIDNDRQKLKEERDTLVIVKHKLAKMKADIDQERQAFEEEKNKLNASPIDIDINTYFDM